jgi:hypothetical protein
MSYDINIWSIKPIKFPDSLPSKDKWSIQKDHACFSKGEWQIVVNASMEVENEDIPDGILPYLPGIEYLTEVSLEPIFSPPVAHTTLIRVINHIAKDIIGVIENVQEDTIKLTTGVKRVAPERRSSGNRFSLIKMSWWFNESPVEKEQGFIDLYNYLKTNFPEALPRRYGIYEPPQYKLEKDGEQHFLEFFFKNKYDSIVWYPHKPVVGIGFTFEKNWGFKKICDEQRFITNRISIEIDSCVFEQHGWKRQLINVWKGLTEIIKPFYGDVRILHDFISGRSTYWIGGRTEDHPVKSGWWLGIPKKLGQAVVLGDPYLSLWDGVRTKGEEKGGLLFISTDDWAKEEDVTSIVGPVPKDIAQTCIPKTIFQKQRLIRFISIENIKRFLRLFGIRPTIPNTDNIEYPKNFPFNKGLE